MTPPGAVLVDTPEPMTPASRELQRQKLRAGVPVPRPGASIDLTETSSGSFRSEAVFSPS